MSGSPVNVVEFLAMSTDPVSVSGNGDGKTRVSDNPEFSEPVRYAWPLSGVGYRGEAAVTEPTVVHLPLVTLAHNTGSEPRLG